MALFTPEVNEVRGSNVSPYSPPVVDYSGVASVGRMFSEAVSDIIKANEPPKISAAERDMLDLQPITEAYRIGEEIRAERGDAAADTYVRMAKIQFVRNRPDLAGKLRTFEEAQAGLGVQENVFENTVKDVVDVFKKTSEGGLKTQQRLQEYTDANGNVDVAGMNAAMYADALEYNANEARLNSIKNKYEAKNATKDELISTILVGFKNQVDTTTNEILKSKGGLERTLQLAGQGAADTPEMLVNAMGLINNELEARRAALKVKFLENGLVVTETELENYMKQANPSLYYSKNALENVAGLDKKFVEQLDNRALASFATRFNGDDAGILSVTNPNTLKLYIESGFFTEEELGALREKTRKAILTPNIETIPVLPWNNINSAPSMLPENYSPEDLSSKDKTQILDMFNAESRNWVQGSQDTTKEDVMEKAKGYLELYKKNQVGTKFPGNIQAAALSQAYATQVISTSLETDANMKNINLLFGDKAFTFIDDMVKYDPTIGSALTKHASVYAQYEARKQFEAFNKNYVVQIQGTPENSPFMLEVEGNSLVFKVKPAFENDRYIRLAKGGDVLPPGESAMSAFVRGRNIPEKTDIYSIFNTWARTGMTGAQAGLSGEPEAMIEKIKNIQLLYQNSFRLQSGHGEKVREYILNQANTFGLR